MVQFFFGSLWTKSEPIGEKKVQGRMRRMIPREQGWRSGESARLPPMWPGFNSRSRCHMWAEYVVGSSPCPERFFSRYSGFPLSSKTNTSKFQLNLERTNTFERASELLSVSWVNKI